MSPAHVLLVAGSRRWRSGCVEEAEDLRAHARITILLS